MDDIETRKLTLKNGIVFNGKLETELTVRLGMVEDDIKLDDCKTQNEYTRTALLLRVVALGENKTPGLLPFNKMTSPDLKRLEVFCNNWDEEELKDLQEAEIEKMNKKIEAANKETDREGEE